MILQTEMARKTICLFMILQTEMWLEKLFVCLSSYISVYRKTICLFMILQTEMWLEKLSLFVYDTTNRDVARKTICL